MIFGYLCVVRLSSAEKGRFDFLHNSLYIEYLLIEVFLFVCGAGASWCRCPGRSVPRLGFLLGGNTPMHNTKWKELDTNPTKYHLHYHLTLLQPGGGDRPFSTSKEISPTKMKTTKRIILMKSNSTCTCHVASGYIKLPGDDYMREK